MVQREPVDNSFLNHRDTLEDDPFTTTSALLSRFSVSNPPPAMLSKTTVFRADRFLEAGLYSEALADLDKLVSVEYELGNTLVTRAATLFKLNRIKDAETDCERALTSHLTKALSEEKILEAYWILGLIRLSQKDTEGVGRIAHILSLSADRSIRVYSHNDSVACSIARLLNARVSTERKNYTKAIDDLAFAREDLQSDRSDIEDSLLEEVHKSLVLCNLLNGDTHTAWFYARHTDDPRLKYEGFLQRFYTSDRPATMEIHEEDLSFGMEEGTEHLSLNTSYLHSHLDEDTDDDFDDDEPDDEDLTQPDFSYSEQSLILYNSQFGKGSPREDQDEKYSLMLDLLWSQDMFASENDEVGIDTSTTEFAQLLDLFDKAEKERHFVDPYPFSKSQQGCPDYHDWELYIRASRSGNLVPAVEREGPAYAFEVARHIYEHNGLNLKDRSIWDILISLQGLDYKPNSYHLLSGGTLSKGDTGPQISEQEFLAINGFILLKLLQKYPLHMYSQEWEVRDIIVIGAMERAGITPAWVRVKNRDILDYDVLKAINKTAFKASILTYQRVHEATPHLHNIKNKTPNVASCWLHMTCDTTDARVIEINCNSGPPNETTNPGDIIKAVKGSTGFSKQEWRRFVKLPEDLCLSLIQTDDNSPITRSVFGALVPAVQLLSQIGEVRKSSLDLILRKYITGREARYRDYRLHINLIRRFCAESEKSAKERGCNLEALRGQFISAIDWGDHLVLVNEQNLPKARWSDFLVASDTWHHKVIEQRSEQAARILATDLHPDWDSLLEQYYDVDHGLNITPLRSHLDTIQESAFMSNCVGDSPVYTRMCLDGEGRLFRISQPSASGQKESPVATVLITHAPNSSRWKAEQIHGPENRTVSNKIREVADDIASRYSKLAKELQNPPEGH